MQQCQLSSRLYISENVLKTWYKNASFNFLVRQGNHRTFRKEQMRFCDNTRVSVWFEYRTLNMGNIFCFYWNINALRSVLVPAVQSQWSVISLHPFPLGAPSHSLLSPLVYPELVLNLCIEASHQLSV